MLLIGLSKNGMSMANELEDRTGFSAKSSPIPRSRRRPPRLAAYATRVRSASPSSVKACAFSSSVANVSHCLDKPRNVALK